MGRQVGWKHHRQLHDLRVVDKAYGGVLEPKLPVREVLCLPGVGLPLYGCRLSRPLEAAPEVWPCRGHGGGGDGFQSTWGSRLAQVPCRWRSVRGVLTAAAVKDSKWIQHEAAWERQQNYVDQGGEERRWVSEHRGPIRSSERKAVASPQSFCFESRSEEEQHWMLTSRKREKRQESCCARGAALSLSTQHQHWARCQEGHSGGDGGCKRWLSWWQGHTAVLQ